MPSEVIVRVGGGRNSVDFAGSVSAVDDAAKAAFEGAKAKPGVAMLLVGDRDYAVALPTQDPDARARLFAQEGKTVRVVFPGRSPVRRRVQAVGGVEAAPTKHGSIDLTEGREGAAPLWLTAEGLFSTDAAGPAPEGMAAAAALVSAARWVSSRRKTTFEQLFPPSAFHPDLPERSERLTADQASRLLDQLDGALAAAAVSGEAAKADAVEAAQVRSASATVLSHVIATVLSDTTFRDAADRAIAAMFRLIEAEEGDATSRPSLRAHAIHLLQMRGPALSADDQNRTRDLLRGLVRQAPPYAELKGTWNFAMCSASEFFDGECEILVDKFKYREIDTPEGSPAAPNRFGAGYRVFEAPYKNVHGEPIRIYGRSARPTDENTEMGVAFFQGLLINRHAQLGSYDMRAASVDVRQDGYKLMMNSQCAGLTTRFAITRMFPDADVYSSWDSTYFRTGTGGKVIASEGADCFLAVLLGMSRGESHAELDKRIQDAQWHHDQARFVEFSQFIGPAHARVTARFDDVNQDGRADYYDGFLDFRLKAMAEDLHASMIPRDPETAASQISGEAAVGLNWAAGSMNRVTQYSDIWAGLRGEAELLYAFQAGGFYSQKEPPQDVPDGGHPRDLGKLPAVTRYEVTTDEAGLQIEVLMHSYLSHAAKELKRLLVAADAMNRAFDLGHFKGDATLMSKAGQRCAVLLTMAGLLEFPADQNFIDGLWAMAIKALQFPEISRSLVRGCITEADHDMSNYYGSRRGLRQLLETLEKKEPIAFAKISDGDETVGRAADLVFT